jgi:hypothetical protein
MAAEGDGIRVEVTAVDGVDWHAQIFQVREDLREGEPYTIRFRAKADAPRDIALYGQIGVPDWHGIGLREQVGLGTGWRTYEYVFTARNVADRNKVSFFVGGRTGTVWFADVTIRPAGR